MSHRSPSLVEQCDHLVVEPAFLQIFQVLLDVRDAGSADDDIIAVCALHVTAVRQPSERDVAHGQPALLGRGLQLFESSPLRGQTRLSEEQYGHAHR